MRLHASRKGFCDRAVEIVYQSLLCDLGSMLEARGLDSPHQVEAEVGPVIIRAIKRPHDLEALEYGEDLVVSLSRTLRGSLPEGNSGDGDRATTLACGPLPPHPKQTPRRPARAA
jgi:hypothetical protein